MEVIIADTEDAAVRITAQLIEKALAAKPQLVLGLATGRTMVKVYAELARMHGEEGLDFSQCTTFNLDEYVGLSPDNPGSYRFFMNQHLFSKINIDISKTHIPNGTAADLDAECMQYEELISKSGGIDLQLLGIGASGHIGFNEPLSALRSRTRAKALTPSTISQNSPLFPSPDLMPKRGLTMGVGTILESRECILLAAGHHKADILARAVEGPITSMVSATALQLHPRCRIIVDEEAAAGLKAKEYYRWIFDNEPEWREFRK